MKLLWTILSGIFFIGQISAAQIPDKVLICGVCRNVEKAVPTTIQSIEKLGSQFLDYQVVIYENNSKDKTKELFQEWAQKNHHVIFLTEYISKRSLAKQLKMKKVNRTEAIARARNKVLDVIMKDKYSDYKYVIWADLDFLNPWDVAHIVETILHPEQEWDAVLANGAYDLFAFRDAEFPVGYELLGFSWWQRLSEIYLALDQNGPWRKVYSAFGGLGIYKRDAIKGCRYSGIVTKDLEQAVTTWLEKASCAKDVCFLKDYKELVAKTKVIDLHDERISKRKLLPKEIGVKLHGENGLGKITWLSCTKKDTLPSTCEHIPFHASMIVRGRDKIFINPRLLCPCVTNPSQ